MTHAGIETILVLDFGAQYSQLIARRIRDLGVYSELRPYNISYDELKRIAPKGIVLSGGPASVFEHDAPMPAPEILNSGIPILGICYGLQIIAHREGGKVAALSKREYGRADVTIDDTGDLFNGFNGSLGSLGSPGRSGRAGGGTPGPTQVMQVWMSHGDTVTELPPGYEGIAHTSGSPFCAIRNPRKKIFGVQFHPEVAHTPRGNEILKNFAYRICGCTGGWDAGSITKVILEEVREAAGGKKVLCALSGGVDSSVLAVLLHEAIGDRLVCMHINNGLMRLNESDQLVSLYRGTYGFDLRSVDASREFLSGLKGVTDPERKRKIVGRTFIEIFEREARSLGPVGFLAQGTLYPDVIESTSFKGPSHTIKTHHNVGGLPERMPFKLIEPFRELFKDEVRAIGRGLGMPEELIGRHPFPGPGLAVRLLGEVTEERLQLLRQADEIFIGELRRAGWYDRVWQAFVVLLDSRSVGVMGDKRTYDHVAALRAVQSTDGMTADWAPLPAELLGKVSNRIVNEIRGINRVVYDISSKPPSTIEWE